MRACLSAIVLSSAALSACATHAELQPTEQEEALAAELQARSIVPATREERAAIRNQDLLTQAAFWAEAYELNPADKEAASELSGVLRRLGGAPRAAEIARQALALYPDDPDLLASFGLALVAAGQGGEALEPLGRVAPQRAGDWRLLNASGVALEQSGRPGRARARFEEALRLSPGEPAVLNNIAMSQLLNGDPEAAEAALRHALQSDRAGPEVRQNLALALALQGRFEEAEEVAVIDVTPTMAEANLDYVRALMSNPRSWDRLRRVQDAGLR